MGKIKFIATVVMLLLFSCGCLAAAETVSTAASNVQILKPINIPQLERNRIIRVYLPPGYGKSDKRYPVLYMHDGQNLFDAATSYAGEWGVDEALNALAKTQALEIIVVGIDNGQEKRMNELSPWSNKRFGKAEGAAYMNFLVNTVKPIIDQQYRTLPDYENTAVMGSSMGGLISHYAIHEYPNVFSKAGIFSPSYWYSKEVYSQTRKQPVPKTSRLYLMTGGKEGKESSDDLKKMTAQLRKQKHPDENLHSEIIADGEHNEAFWCNEFPKAVTWLFQKP
jgi:predicted alpha/beta superfamily hydrolase